MTEDAMRSLYWGLRHMWQTAQLYQDAEMEAILKATMDTVEAVRDTRADRVDHAILTAVRLVAT